MTPDQYRREGFQAGIEAAAEACADYPRTSPDETEWTHYDEQIAHSQACIRAIDVDEVLAGMPPAPDAVAQLVLNADRLLPEFLATAARNIDFDGPWDEFDLSGGLLSLIAAMETSHD